MARKKKAEPSDTSDSIQPTESGFLVVGIGASAGGINALQRFFENTQPGSGIAYVVILHLSPTHDSRLAEVLQSVTEMPVKQVTEREFVEPNRVYVVPPNQHLTMIDGHVGVLPNVSVEERRAPVDIFFRTLAESHGARGVAVILSGTGGNGSMGIKRIKEQGGVIFVQDPREAEFSEMPRHSIATEFVDEVLPVADIPKRIIEYRDSLGRVDIPKDALDRASGPQQEPLREIFTQLRVRTGHDFSNYRRPTLLRRIERRMIINSVENLSAYAKCLRDRPEEAQALLKDLLISVTNFFRDPKPYSYLEDHLLPKLFAEKNADDEVRLWCVGCATGEEAYSLAMLCAEKTLGINDSPKVQVFASDIDEKSIAIAREGLYSLNDAADVSPERLKRFFSKEGDNFRVKRELREMVLFAHQNVIKDPPFSHLSLVSCRNLLIYLNQSAKERVMDIFHFALDPGGYLFLGTSESVEGAGHLFSTVSRENHIYQSRRTGKRPFSLPESVPQFRFEVPPTRTGGSDTGTRSSDKRVLERITYADLHQQLLERYAPPSVVVDEEYDIVHLSDRAGKYLRMPGGATSVNLLKVVRPDLRLELRSVLYQAVQLQAPVETHEIRIRIGGETESLTIHARPALNDDEAARGFILVIFVPAAATGEELVYRTDDPLATRLEEEISRSRAQLRSSSEQYEIQAEELKASNEELQAMNEELRAAAEELETSKEELQSINEELRTVNQELKVKVEETIVASNNLQNLINSSEIGTIFLDRELRVQFFTPTAREIFNLIAADQGRALSDITNNLDGADLIRDSKLVMKDLQTLEREVISTAGAYYLMRIIPYRTEEERIEGVVLTFFNITARKNAERELKRSEERVRLIIESAKDYAIFSTDLEGKVDSWNSGAETMFGYAETEMLGLGSETLFTTEDRENGAPQEEAMKAMETGRAESERWHVRKDRSQFFGSGLVMPLRNSGGEAVGLVKIMRDLTRQKQSQNEIERFNSIAVGRENRMIELKKEINRLLERLGDEPKFSLEFDDDQ